VQTSSQFPPRRRGPPAASAPTRRVLGLVALGLLLSMAGGGRAQAEPGWVTDFKAKAKGWEERAHAALDRLEAASRAAQDKLDKVMKERADELERVLGENRDALDAALAEQNAAWAAVIAARFEQVTMTADSLSSDLESIAAGTGRFVNAETGRLTAGLRQSVSSGLREADVKLGEARIVDQNVIADAETAAAASASRWLFILLIVAGGLVLLVGAPLSYGHDKLLALAFVVLGAGLAGFGIYKLRGGGGDAAQPVALGLTECPALAEAHDFIARHGPKLSPTSRPAATSLRLHLARCQALAADDVLAQLAAVELKRLHQLTGGK
jgi:hypothetical protein